jgi:hypothetical protein
VADLFKYNKKEVLREFLERHDLCSFRQKSNITEKIDRVEIDMAN